MTDELKAYIRLEAAVSAAFNLLSTVCWLFWYVALKSAFAASLGYGITVLTLSAGLHKS